MTRRAILSVLFTLLALAVALPAHADLVMEKKVQRHFPGSFPCPFVNQLELSFIANSPNAVITFDASKVDQEPFKIFDVAVVDRDTLIRRFNTKVGKQCMDGDLAFYERDASDGDLVDDPFNWSLTNADLSDVLQMGINPGETEARASVLVSGLVPGREYFITGWSDRGEFDIEVDCPPPTAFFLADGRFQVEVLWSAGKLLAGVLPYSEQTAGVWLREPAQLEMIVSIINHCDPYTGKGTFWVLFGGTTAEKLWLTVTDTYTGIEKDYRNGSQTRLKTVVDKKTFRCQG